MGDALAMTVLQARGFKEKDYARHHPSGAIGRALLMKVRDIMRTGDRNAVAGGELDGQGSVAADVPRQIRQRQHRQPRAANWPASSPTATCAGTRRRTRRFWPRRWPA